MRLRFAAVAMVAGFFACNPPSVSMTLDMPSGVTPSWIEVGAFPTACPSPDEISGGLPPSGLAARVAYPASSPIAFGLLDTGTYGFAAVARRDDCGVIAAGCANANVASARAIDISLDPTNNPDASACTEGLVCDNARCVPPTNGDDPNAGAGCSMILVGAGPLPDALDGGPFVTAPAIAALSNGGFVIAYGEYLGLDGTYRVTTQPIDSGGGALTPNQQILDGHCPDQTSIDAAGLVMGASSGLVALSRPPCSDTDASAQSGFELLPLDGSGAIVKRNLFLNPTAPPVMLSTHALTTAAASNRFLLAANVSGAATLLTTDTANVTAQTTTAFGTPEDATARVVRTTSALAVEVDGPSVADAGITGVVGRVYLTSSTTDPISLGAPVDQVPASITALGALDTRAFLVLNGAGNGDDVAVRGYDLGKAGVQVTAGFSSLKSSTLFALDAAAAQNRFFAAIEEQDSVEIAVLDGASSSSPELLRRVDLASDIRIPKSAHDGPIAIAATDTTVAITWVEHKGALPDGDPIGGYAVFRMSSVITTASMVAPSGEAVAHVVHGGERRALLVRGGAPDETLRAKFDLAERPARAEILEIISPSAARVEAPCDFVAACGGCDWMHLARIAQRAQHIALAESLSRGAPITFHEASRDLAYRTRARVHARENKKNKLEIGFFAARSRELAIVDRCIVLDERIDRARTSLAALFAGARLHSRGEGEISLALGKTNPVAHVRWSHDLPAEVFARIDEAVRKKSFDGFSITCGESRRPARVGDPTPWIVGADGAPLELASGGFSQAHEGVNAELAACVAREVGGAKKIVELYAGSGNLTVVLARDADVRAVESDEAACEAARRNLAARSLKARATCADASHFEIPTADAIVLDPPRTGARDACAALVKSRAKRIVYVSCDRMTLARDLDLLAPRFRLASLHLFEMFPHTSHIETVATLERAR